jgi:hypothetical protein
MKYVCLGYLEENQWDVMSENERNFFMDECVIYDDLLRKSGHFVGGEALQSARNATTLRYKDRKIKVTDGPFAETKEQLGGIMILEAADLNQAIELMSKHPSIRMGGSWEIRPTDDLDEMVEQSHQRRSLQSEK